MPLQQGRLRESRSWQLGNFDFGKGVVLCGVASGLVNGWWSR